MKKPQLRRIFPIDRQWAESITGWLEIVGGQKGNAFVVPELKALTFSNPPTQAECRALEDKVNEVFKLVKQVAERLDA